MTTPSVSVLPTATTASPANTPAAPASASARGTGASLAPTGKGHAAFADLLQRRHHLQTASDDARLDAQPRGRHDALDDLDEDGELALTPAMALALLQQDDRFVAPRLPGGTDTADAEDGALASDGRRLAVAGDAAIAASDEIDLALPRTTGATTAATLLPADADPARQTAPGGREMGLVADGRAREAEALPRQEAAGPLRATASDAVATPAAQAAVQQAATIAASAKAADAAQAATPFDDTARARLLPEGTPAALTVPQGTRAGAAVSPRTAALRAEMTSRADAANASDRDVRGATLQASADARRDAPLIATPLAAFTPVAIDPANATSLAPQFVESQAAGAAMASPVSSHAAAPGAAPAALPGATPLPSALVAPTVGSPLWAGAFSHQMVAISQRAGATAIQTAELHLNPPDLGPLRVLLSMNGDQAQAIFVSAHGAVRSAVEAALPQLQQSLADAGIQLGQASVGEQAPQEQSNDAGRGQRRGDTQADAGTDAAIVVETPVRVTQGLIDAYA